MELELSQFFNLSSLCSRGETRIAARILSGAKPLDPAGGYSYLDHTYFLVLAKVELAQKADGT